MRTPNIIYEENHHPENPTDLHVHSISKDNAQKEINVEIGTQAYVLTGKTTTAGLATIAFFVIQTQMYTIKEENPTRRPKPNQKEHQQWKKSRR